MFCETDTGRDLRANGLDANDVGEHRISSCAMKATHPPFPESQIMLLDST